MRRPVKTYGTGKLKIVSFTSVVYTSCRLCYYVLQNICHLHYRVSHVLVDLGWVEFDFCVPPSCPAASRFCQVPISPSRVGQTVEHSKSKSTKPSLRADESPCILVTLSPIIAIPVLRPPSSKRAHIRVKIPPTSMEATIKGFRPKWSMVNMQNT